MTCICKQLFCVCPLIKGHEETCKFRISAICAIPIECEHGYDVCPQCDTCTCTNPKLLVRNEEDMDEIETARCDAKIAFPDWYKGDVFIPPNASYTLILTYPLSTEYNCDIISDKIIGTNTLINKICSVYKNEIFKNEDKYGIWGHGIEDLVIEKIRVNHTKKTIRVDIGS